jgi:branched-chain amino acid transport system substrate-binding protein
MTMLRTARGVAAGSALVLVVAACGGAGADADGRADAPVVIGALTSLTGPFTPYGVQALAGMQLAVDEVNAAGGVDGRPVELVDVDDRNDPDRAATELERMVEQDGVVAVGGVISSSVGVVTAEVAEDLGVPLLVVKAGSEAVLTAASRHTFRTCLPAAPMTAPPLVEYVAQEGFARVGVIIADYAWGQSIRASLEDAFAGTDVELQFEVAPVGETDFTTYLRSLQAFDPDVVAATGHPPGAAAITVQAADLGLDVPVTGPFGALATVLEGVGEIAYDSYADYGCVDFEDPGYQALARRFSAASGLAFMEADAVAGYGIVQAVVASVRTVGDDPGDVAAHLHATTFATEGLAYPLAWTAWGELSAATTVLSIIREQTPPDGVNAGAAWYPRTIGISGTLTPWVPG